MAYSYPFLVYTVILFLRGTSETRFDQAERLPRGASQASVLVWLLDHIVLIYVLHSHLIWLLVAAWERWRKMYIKPK